MSKQESTPAVSDQELGVRKILRLRQELTDLDAHHTSVGYHSKVIEILNAIDELKPNQESPSSAVASTSRDLEKAAKKHLDSVLQASMTRVSSRARSAILKAFESGAIWYAEKMFREKLAELDLGSVNKTEPHVTVTLIDDSETKNPDTKARLAELADCVKYRHHVTPDDVAYCLGKIQELEKYIETKKHVADYYFGSTGKDLQRIAELEAELSDTRQCYYEVVEQRNALWAENVKLKRAREVIG